MLTPQEALLNLRFEIKDTFINGNIKALNKKIASYLELTEGILDFFKNSNLEDIENALQNPRHGRKLRVTVKLNFLQLSAVHAELSTYKNTLSALSDLMDKDISKFLNSSRYYDTMQLLMSQSEHFTEAHFINSQSIADIRNVLEDNKKLSKKLQEKMLKFVEEIPAELKSGSLHSSVTTSTKPIENIIKSHGTPPKKSFYASSFGVGAIQDVTENVMLKAADGGKTFLKKGAQFMSKKWAYLIPVADIALTASDIYDVSNYIAYETELRDPNGYEEYSEMVDTKIQYNNQWDQSIAQYEQIQSDLNPNQNEIDELYHSLIEGEKQLAQSYSAQNKARLEELSPEYLKAYEHEMKQRLYDYDNYLHFAQYPKNAEFYTANADKHPELHLDKSGANLSVGYADNTPENWRIHYDQKPDILYK